MSDPDKHKVSRRRMVAGAGTAGALAAAAAVIPARKQSVEEAAKAQPADATDEGGYRLTEHVLRYYQTTRV